MLLRPRRQCGRICPAVSHLAPTSITTPDELKSPSPIKSTDTTGFVFVY